MGLFSSKCMMHFMPTSQDHPSCPPFMPIPHAHPKCPPFMPIPHAHPSCPPHMPTPHAHPSDHTSLPAPASIHTRPPCSLDSVLSISCHLRTQDFVCANPRTHNWEKTWYLSFWNWLDSFNMVFGVHFPLNATFSFFISENIVSYVHTTFSWPIALLLDTSVGSITCT